MLTRDSSGNSRKQSKGQRQAQIPRYDQRLQAAKNAGRSVRFTLAIEAPFANDDCEVTGTIIEVDKFNILIAQDESEIWIAKMFIVGTEVLL